MIYSSEIDSLKIVLHKSVSLSEKFDIYYKLTDLYTIENQDSALKYSENLIQLAQNLNDRKRLVNAYHLRGEIELLLNNIDSAFAYFVKCDEMYRNNEIDEMMFDVYIRLGGLAFTRGNYINALRYYQDGLSIAETMNHKYAIAVFYTNLAVVHSTQKDYSKAMDYLFRTLKIQEEDSLYCDQIFTLATIGQLYSDQDELEVAHKHLSIGLELIDDCQNILFKTQFYAVFGEVETKLGNYRKATEFLHHALNLSTSISENEREFTSQFFANVYEQLGKTNQKIGDYKSSIRFYQHALLYCSRSLNPSIYSNVAKGLATTFIQTGRLDSALFYYTEFHENSDSLLNEESIRKIAQLELKYEYEKEMERQKFENKLAEAARKKKSQLVNFSLILVILVLIIVFLNYRSALKKSEFKRKQAELIHKNLKMELEFKNKELVTKAIYLHRSEEFIQAIANRLNEYRRKATTKDDREIVLILKELEFDRTKKEWKEFELRFNEVHNDFYNRLKNRFTDLSQNDLKLCAFLKLQMSTKEIADITFQSQNTINVARYRLRKKLRLDTEVNLNKYLYHFPNGKE